MQINSVNAQIILILHTKFGKLQPLAFTEPVTLLYMFRMQTLDSSYKCICW